MSAHELLILLPGCRRN